MYIGNKHKIKDSGYYCPGRGSGVGQGRNKKLNGISHVLMYNLVKGIHLITFHNLFMLNILFIYIKYYIL